LSSCAAAAPLRRARRDYSILSEAARLLSAAPENVPELIVKQTLDLREAGQIHATT